MPFEAAAAQSPVLELAARAGLSEAMTQLWSDAAEQGGDPIEALMAIPDQAMNEASPRYADLRRNLSEQQVKGLMVDEISAAAGIGEGNGAEEVEPVQAEAEPMTERLEMLEALLGQTRNDDVRQILGRYIETERANAQAKAEEEQKMATAAELHQYALIAEQLGDSEIHDALLADAEGFLPEDESAAAIERNAELVTAPEPQADETVAVQPADEAFLAPEAALAPADEPMPAEPSEMDVAAHESATSPENDLPEPSEAQKEAGNYRKGKVRLHGLEISIENPAGSRRQPEWEPLANHYGYIKRSEGADGEHVDVFIGPDPDSELAYIIDQVDPETHEFDEHKLILGAHGEDEARAIYQANYQTGWQGLGGITEMSIDELKSWLSKPQSEPLGLLDNSEDGAAVSPESIRGLATQWGAELSGA